MRNGVDKVDCGWIKDSVEQQVKGFGIFFNSLWEPLKV